MRGHFKNLHGSMNFWTGDLDRDAHLKSADFLDVGNHPKILFRSTRVDQVGASSYRVGGDLTIRGITRPVTLDVQYLGQWSTPYWEDGVDKGPVIRAGFAASAVIHRHDFQCSWNAPLDRGGLVVGSEVYIDLDIEALAVS